MENFNATTIPDIKVYRGILKQYRTVLIFLIPPNTRWQHKDFIHYNIQTVLLCSTIFVHSGYCTFSIICRRKGFWIPQICKHSRMFSFLKFCSWNYFRKEIAESLMIPQMNSGWGEDSGNISSVDNSQYTALLFYYFSSGQ